MDSSFCSGGSSSEEEPMHLMEELDAKQYGTFVELLDLHRFHDFLELQLNTLKNNSSIKGIRIMLAQLHHEIAVTQEERQEREDDAYLEDAEQANQMMARLRGLSARIQSHRQIQDRRRTKKAAQRSQSDGQLPRPSLIAIASTPPLLDPEQRLPTPMAALLSMPDPQNIHAPREILTVEKQIEAPSRERGKHLSTRHERDVSRSEVSATFDRYAHNLTQQPSEASLDQLWAELRKCDKTLYGDQRMFSDRLAKLKAYQKMGACADGIIRLGGSGQVSSQTVGLAEKLRVISRFRISELNGPYQKSRRAEGDPPGTGPAAEQRNSTSKLDSQPSPVVTSFYLKHPATRPLPPMPAVSTQKTYRTVKPIVAKTSVFKRKARRNPRLILLESDSNADTNDDKVSSKGDVCNDSGIGESIENEWSSCSEDDPQQDMKQVVRASLDSALHEVMSGVKSSLGYRHAEDYDADSESHDATEEDITICLGDDFFDESVSEFSSDGDASTILDSRISSIDSTCISEESTHKHETAANTRRWRYYEPTTGQTCASERSTREHETPPTTKYYSLEFLVSRLHDESSLRCLDRLHSAFYDELLNQPTYHRVWKNHEQSMLHLACKTYIPNDIHHRSPNSFNLLSLHGDDTLQDYEVCRENTTEYGDCATHVFCPASTSDAMFRGCIRGGAPCLDESSPQRAPVKLEFLDRLIIDQKLHEVDRDTNRETPNLSKSPPNTARTRPPGYDRLTINAAVREAEQASRALFDKHLEIAQRQAAEQPVCITDDNKPAARTAAPAPPKRKRKKIENLQEESQSSSDKAYIANDAESEENLVWIDRFVNSRGNEYFCDIDEEYLTDRFNLTSLNTEVQYYQYALDLVTDMLEIECEDDMRETIEKSARHLYGLVHARYIVTTRGLQKMCEKYKAGDFGKCPRVACDGTHLLPMGQNDTANLSPVKLYCAKCEDLYNPKSSRHATVDGAYFGTSFHNIFFQVYPSMMPAKSQKRHEPRVFGFKMHASAALARWQAEAALALRERVMQEGLETGFEAEEREKDGEGSEVEEQDGIDDMFEVGSVRVPQVLR